MMKKVLLTAVLVVFSAMPVMAANKIAVVDTRVLLTESKAAKSIQSQMDKQRKKYQSEVQKDEKKLHAEGEAISSKRESMSAEEFTQARQAFEKNVQKVQIDVQEKRRNFDMALKRAEGVLKESAMKVVSEIAAAEGIDVVLKRQNVFIAADSLDITARVLEKLDKSLTKVPVKWEIN